MNANTKQPTQEKKQDASSCCGDKAGAAEKPHQQVKPQTEKLSEKSSCCCK